MDFFLQNNSVENSLICPKNKSASHCPTELFPIYPNNHWTIRRRDDHIVVPSSNRIKLKIDWFQHSTLCPPNCTCSTIIERYSSQDLHTVSLVECTLSVRYVIMYISSQQKCHKCWFMQEISLQFNRIQVQLRGN